ncbi:MAG: ZIP family metal transporter [Methylophilaceae bacterium]|jgi:zinc and cadmium transporter|nr:ZIP family metal transporter [Methylophilaceae bacterium]
MLNAHFSVIAWIISASLLGGALSVLCAGLVALSARAQWVPMLVSYAIGAMLGAVFLEILPHAFHEASSVENMAATVLFGILLFFVLEKLVLWRHCHGEHCEAHAMHTEEECQLHQHSSDTNTKFKVVTEKSPSISKHIHSHQHDSGRSGMMIMVGDTFHNFVDGILIAAAFMIDIRLGAVTAMAIIAHEIPQEVGDFLILLHSGYSKKQAFLFNLLSSFATVVGGVLAYFALQTVQSWVPSILGLAAASMLYVAVADLIPGLHKRTELKATLSQVALIALGIGSIWLTKFFLE